MLGEIKGSKHLQSDVSWSWDSEIGLNFIQLGKLIQNAFVESFNGKFIDSCLNQHWFRSLEEARNTIKQRRQDYNGVRPQSSLSYQPLVYL
ncbi:MAG: hypothetical protein CMQ38_12000 [Gammaproteobacteria bacterium]|nr:hypothetical protein [Gammaproteobacteria bacterium]